MTNEINNIIKNRYKYGFNTPILKKQFPKGINIKNIQLLSNIRKEFKFLQNFRIKAYQKWKTFLFPKWANLTIPFLNFQKITYYSVIKYKNKKKINSKIYKTFEKLGISLKENSNIAIDAVFDSESITTTYKEKLAKHGVIFCSILEAIQNYPYIIKKFLGLVVPPSDNYFAALNSAVFTDGSFCFIPKNIQCPLDLSTYFRINDKESGQFERTLIIAEKNSKVRYLEGCTAPKYSQNQLHAAIVELIAFENAHINYYTIQNWFSGNSNGIGGILNFVTKRALCLGKRSSVQWTQIETGSAITWKYPGCVLLGDQSSGEFYSITITNNYQQADTGTKMLHLGKKTTSKIISKGISAEKSKNTYRGLVKISSNAKFSKNFSQCDSFLLGSESLASTYPYIDISNNSSIVEHEAKISKLSDDQIFYLIQRGISLNQAISLIINGFCKDIIELLPFEFATEANKLLTLKLESKIG